MANEVTITSICRACGGTGIDLQIGPGDPVELPCQNCGATGWVTTSDGQVNAGAKISGSYFDDVINKLTDIKEKVDEIKAVVDEL